MQHLDLIGNDKLFSVNLSTNEKGGTLMMKSFFTLLFLIVTLLSNLFSKVISVPKDFVKIQVALDASSDGDTILVEKGLYKENIDFYGKKVVVTSRFNDSGDTRFIKKTIIKGQGDEPTVTFASNEGLSSALIGFTISGGEGSIGGGVFCSMASPLLKNLIIKENQSEKGGGIGLYSSDPQIQDVKIIDNRGMWSGGLYLTGYSSPIINNALIVKNTTFVNGGSIYVEEYSNPVFNNVTISDNGFPKKVPSWIKKYFGEIDPMMVNGIHISNGSNVVFNSSIIIGDADLEVYFGEYGESSSLTISYSNLDGGRSSVIDNYKRGTIHWMEGNISADPKFINPKKNNYMLQSTSPSINKGNPQVLGKNMGANIQWD